MNLDQRFYLRDSDRAPQRKPFLVALVGLVKFAWEQFFN